MNYNYAKIENNNIVFAPTILKCDGYEIINPHHEDYIINGYLEVVKTEQPQREGYYYTKSVESVNGVPTEVWHEHEIINDAE